MASRMKWEAKRGWRASLKSFKKKHQVTLAEMAAIIGIHVVVVSDYLSGRRNSTRYGRRGIIALLEDWEDAEAGKVAKILGTE